MADKRRVGWDLIPVDLPTAGAVAAEPRLANLENNPLYRYLVSRRRFRRPLAGPGGNWQLAFTVRMPRSIILDLIHAGLTPREFALAIWGVSARRRAVRSLRRVAAFDVALGWLIIFATLSFQVGPPTNLARFVAVYFLLLAGLLAGARAFPAHAPLPMGRLHANLLRRYCAASEKGLRGWAILFAQAFATVAVLDILFVLLAVGFLMLSGFMRRGMAPWSPFNSPLLMGLAAMLLGGAIGLAVSYFAKRRANRLFESMVRDLTYVLGWLAGHPPSERIPEG